jgi:chemotaxis response regulator CheB
MNDKPIDQPREEDATPDRDAFPIVGIGGSAGAIDALMAFFPAASADCGLAFVVIQHLAPDHKSLLPELLARCTRLRIVEPKEDMAVEPNHVYCHHAEHDPDDRRRPPSPRATGATARATQPDRHVLHVAGP